MNFFKIPENLKKFYYDYNHSKFLECNSEMAKMSFLLSNGTYRQNESQNKKLKHCSRIRKNVCSILAIIWKIIG
jgi:hypothetical protein